MLNIQVLTASKTQRLETMLLVTNQLPPSKPTRLTLLLTLLKLVLSWSSLPRRVRPSLLDPTCSRSTPTVWPVLLLQRLLLQLQLLLLHQNLLPPLPLLQRLLPQLPSQVGFFQTTIVH
ncbi:hypothetical protein BCR33DRAFT_719143, partial [Rhizoclosmatium globosum]